VIILIIPKKKAVIAAVPRISAKAVNLFIVLIHPLY